MSEANFQTVNLTKGSHRSPDEGVCVMELASMLADEPFGDHPRSACPVIGSLLRTYNDRIDDRRRQDLYQYAARLVGTRDRRRARRARAALCREWSREHGSPVRINKRFAGPSAAGRQAALVATADANDATHHEVLALIDELLQIGSAPELMVDARECYPRPKSIESPPADDRALARVRTERRLANERGERVDSRRTSGARFFGQAPG
jgi:hypothetical protein